MADTSRKCTYTKGFKDFIDDEALEGLVADTEADPIRVREIIAKSLAKEPLQAAETAVLLNAEDPELIEEIFAAARRLKRDVYGNRIVLFAPLYVGNHCINDCRYCAFRRSNPDEVRRTLTMDELRTQVGALEDNGHKRLILVYGEHPKYSPEYIAETVRTVYDVRKGQGEIRRVNINAAPLEPEGFKTVKAAGIGTYQIFQETYHHGAYRKYHPADTQKGNYEYRLDSLSRAFEAGCDDMGAGALFGLADWKFEVLALVTHSLYLQQRYGVGPHTISFPRIQPASGVDVPQENFVSDDEFKRLIAILRLSVPYTGMILTARESPEIRREVMEFGVSQIDAGSRIEIGGYTEFGDAQVMRREQFALGDLRSLDEVMRELIEQGNIPSFCTSCYRLGRTGEEFMEYAIPGFIHNFCTPNALCTLSEYVEDYASTETRAAAEKLITDELAKIEDGKLKKTLVERLHLIRDEGQRDLYF